MGIFQRLTRQKIDRLTALDALQPLIERLQIFRDLAACRRQVQPLDLP